jgi:hypothetical protein
MHWLGTPVKGQRMGCDAGCCQKKVQQCKRIRARSSTAKVALADYVVV